MLLTADEIPVLELLASLRADEERNWRNYKLRHRGASLKGLAHFFALDAGEIESTLERLVRDGIVERHSEHGVSYKVVDYNRAGELLHCPPMVSAGPRLRVSPLSERLARRDQWTLRPAP